MSASPTFTTDSINLANTNSSASDHASESLHYILTHVFLPIKLPNCDDYHIENDLSLLRAVCSIAHAYSAHVNENIAAQWHRITRMLDRLQVSLQLEHLDQEWLISELREMRSGDILTFFIRRQNAAIVLTKRENSTLFESFELSLREDAVAESPGSLICSYPGSAIEVQNNVFEDQDFRIEFSRFLSLPDTTDSCLPHPPVAHPQYITALLSGILRSIGRTANVLSITKRIRDHVGRAKGEDNAIEDQGVWRRSSLWLLVRVAMEISFDRSPLGCTSYKEFMLFFVCMTARDAKDHDLSSDLLHLMATKILRRLGKLGPAVPDWLSEMALGTCASIREILDVTWRELRSIHSRPSPFRNPSQGDLRRDTDLSLRSSHEYINNALTNRHHEPINMSFHPGNRRHGTIEDFLSSNGAKFLDDSFEVDPAVTLYEIEKSVEQDIDEWFAYITNMEDACVQLEILMDGYMDEARATFGGNPEDFSIKVLTALELFIALDKLVVREIPMLADYSPEIPIALLEMLLLQKETNLHRLARAYQYLSMRHSQSHPGWSVLSDKFTEDSFPVRYYDQSPDLQRLKTRIERDALEEVYNAHPHQEAIFDGCHQESQYFQEQLNEVDEVTQLRLPVIPLHVKVVVFELQCPACIHIWRSATSRILYYCLTRTSTHPMHAKLEETNLLAHVPALRPHFVNREQIPLAFQIHFAYFDRDGLQSRSDPTICYVAQYYEESSDFGDIISEVFFSRWWRNEHCDYLRPTYGTYTNLEKYISRTSHTSNDILASQVDCPADLSLEEFLTFSHLRSGGSLQWANILRGLRNRTLNFRRRNVHCLLSQAAFHIGPLDLNTGAWIWHQDLQDSSFCDALLDELDNLFVEVGAGSIDGMVMSNISLLLTRIIVSSPGEGISERSITLLKSVRRKTLRWVQELSYNLVKAPTNKERSNLLLEMAAACRSTFNVDSKSPILRKLFYSAEDVDAALSSAFLLCTLGPECMSSFPTSNTFADEASFDGYTRLILERDRRLSFALEVILGDAILADVSNYGVDLAVRSVFVYHKPSTYRWERLQYPNAHWLACKTKEIEGRSPQTVHFDLLTGTLQVDGQPLGGLPRAIRNDRRCQSIFRDQGFFVVPSSLPGMDFTTLAVMSKHKVHFSLRGDRLVVRAQDHQSNSILELIPAHILQEDLPPTLVRHHVHWLNFTSKTIEIRPLDHLWEQSSENWRIDCATEQYRMFKGRETLVDIRSSTWAMVSACFECLDNVNPIDPAIQIKNILVTVSPVMSLPFVSAPVLQLSVKLPYYGLSFFVNSGGDLESRDFQDMVYDENQCVETLFGLENLLVLRQKAHLAKSFIPRRVLIPDCRFVENDRNHRVGVESLYLFDKPDEPLYHAYEVDTELGCLMGDGSSNSMRLLALLHAMTSCGRPDPLTGKTGAQAAFHFIQSAGCRSIMRRKTMGTDSFWNWETKYPQINAEHDKIGWSRVIPRCLYGHRVVNMEDKRAMQRAAYLFPSKVTGIATEDCEDTDYLILQSDLELEGVAFAAASAVYRWSINTPSVDTISDWTTIWGAEDMCMNGTLGDYSTNLVQAARDILQTKNKDTHLRFLFLLPTMAYCLPRCQAAFLSMLVVFARHFDPECLGNTPIYADCRISDGYRPTEEDIWCHLCEFHLQPEWRWGSDMKKYMVDITLKHLLKDWPHGSLATLPHSDSSLWICWDVASLTSTLRQLLSSCYRNSRLKEHLIHVITGSESSISQRLVSSPRCERAAWQITLDQLLFERQVPELPSRADLLHGDNHQKPSDDTSNLNQLFSSISTNASIFSLKLDYIALLQKSAQHVHKERFVIQKLKEDDCTDTLERYYTQCRANYFDALGALAKRLAPTNDPYWQALSQFGYWPPVTADTLLRCLASTSPINVPGPWKKYLISLALLLLDLRRARRLLRFVLDGLEKEFSMELENSGCDGWDPEEYPDWLLIQLQGNFLIRRVQVEMAMELMSPQSNENTITQVNMGEGKSSVVIPIAATALANGQQLVRVIVPRALTTQMFDLLVSRLGGLANRQIFYLPFCRPSKYTNSDNLPQTNVIFEVDDVKNIISHCMSKRGILLVQPEHVVSLKLMSIDAQISESKAAVEVVSNLQDLIYKHIGSVLSLNKSPGGSLVGNMFRWLSQSPNRSSKMDVTQTSHPAEHGGDANVAPDNASKWLDLQKWIHSHSRDILDESDEILHARFQLIYTIGLQQHVDGYSDRWTITQQVLSLVKKHAHSLSQYAPDLVEYESGIQGSFPYVHILRASDVSRHLISLIVEDVMAGQIPNFKFQCVSPALHDAIRSFISDEDVLQIPDTAKRVEDYANLCSRQMWNGLLLLRGLLSSNVLLFALTTWRWRVDYGLVLPLRSPDHASPITMLAVPYRAKDVPALGSHFSHPDIAIILTCLSYYYGGLDENQLRVAFELLLDEDDPATDYAIWIEEYDSDLLPDSLRTLSEINLKSSEQWDKIIFPLFRWNQAAIDFYLARLVFPQEMKEYPSKLRASSWDLAEKRERLVTGFSGTNDGRWLLPMSIRQHDLDHQRGTNARVLAYLLQPENHIYVVTHKSGQRWSTIGFLETVATQQPKIRIVLDVGAQILDLSNRQVAKAWLDIVRDASGAVHFNENDELIVLMRNGSTVPLLSSPLSQKLDRCVVYLDHAHTRGTDIKLPIGSRAAVILGSKVTKDRLVQGCMRLRKLGHGHSIMFFAPPEIDRSIRAVSSKRDPETQITVVDVLSWAINETWTDIQQRAPYWAQQGMNHKSRYNAWTDFASGKITREKLGDVWLQPDRKSLVDLYAATEAKNSPHSLSQLDPDIRQRCKNLGVLSLPNAELAEEQEREVSREQEREREVELPPKAEPARHYLHPDVIEFVKTGNISRQNMTEAFCPIFTALEKSSAATLEGSVWSPLILATTDFCNTVKAESTQGSIDQYLRPVQWILSRKGERDPLLVLLSQFEVDCLIRDIRSSEHVHLHLYAPRTSQRMRPSDDLKLYTIPTLPTDWIPPWALIDQLNVFAGQLYLRDYDSYLRLCRFLGVPTKDTPNDTAVRWNLLNIPGSIEENEIRFSSSPLPSVMALLFIRTRGRAFTRTHMGRILQGHLLMVKDFNS